MSTQTFWLAIDKLILKHVPLSQIGELPFLKAPEANAEFESLCKWYDGAYLTSFVRESVLDSDIWNLTRTWASGDAKRFQNVLGDVPKPFGPLYPQGAAGEVGHHNVKTKAMEFFQVWQGQKIAPPTQQARVTSPTPWVGRRFRARSSKRNRNPLHSLPVMLGLHLLSIPALTTSARGSILIPGTTRRPTSSL